MKHIIKNFYVTILFTSFSAHATVIVRGNNNQSPFGFTSPVTAKAFDHKTGTFFVGLESGGGDFALSRASRPNFNTQLTFIPLASGDLSNQSIEFLSLSFADNAPTVATVVIKSGEPFSANVVSALPAQRGAIVTSTELQDAQEQPTAGIVHSAASSTSILAAVRPDGGNFGSENGGIALITINRKTDGTIELVTKDATTGAEGNKAIALQSDSEVLGGGETTVIFAEDEENNVALHFDEKLNLFYIGVRIQPQIVMFGRTIGKSVVIAQPGTQTNAIELKEIVTNDALANSTQIIVGQGGLVTPLNLRPLNLRVLHASTGPTYLIVNGGTDVTSRISNKIFALPLVNLPNSPEHGKLANKNANLSNGAFTQPATQPDHLPTDRDIAALVGTGDLPIDPSTPISDIEVVGDTVYVSIKQTPDNVNDTGVFYCQALFNAQGKIIRWTPWTKRATPFNAFGQTTLAGDQIHDGSVSFFSIDPTTGNSWIVEGTTNQVVGVTTWIKNSNEKNLVAEINKKLTDGCFSVLDLDQATRGFLRQTSHRYAFFGGNNAVIFTRVSEAIDNTILTSPQTIITDFSLPENFALSQLPENTGIVKRLEYSKRDPNFNNFFFAGTEKGLFVFAKNDGAGFTADELQTIDMTPFSDGVWTKIDGIAGSVVDMKCAGNSLYVLTTQFTSDQPFIDTLYNIRFVNVATVNNLAANSNVIAQTKNGIFENVTAFFGIGIVATGREQFDDSDPFDKVEVREQLVLATSNGLFKTNANQTRENNIPKGSADATSQNDANWQNSIDVQGAFLGIGTIETPVQHTLWPFSLEDANNLKIFSNGAIHQINGAETPALLEEGTRADEALVSASPAQFNAKNSTIPLDIITDFWSDGGRRFFIFNRTSDPADENKLGIFPFDAQKFNLAAPNILNQSALEQVKSFFWIKAIGATGLILAGTNQGIVGLE